MKNLKSQSGRSMVEMLGVLAIIGVLSIGGIAGYTMAMNRYRANEILNAASQVAIMGMSKNAGQGDDATLQDIGYAANATLHGATISYEHQGVAEGAAAGSVTITGADAAVGTAMENIAGDRIECGDNGASPCTFTPAAN